MPRPVQSIAEGSDAVTENQEPPRHIWLSLDEALELLAGLEDARDTFFDTGHFAAVVGIEYQIRQLSRRLDFDDLEGEMPDER